MTLDLMTTSQPCVDPASFDPVEGATAALREKFILILTSEGYSLSDIKFAQLTFLFGNKNWPIGASMSIVSQDNAKNTVVVDQNGRPAEIISFNK